VAAGSDERAEWFEADVESVRAARTFMRRSLESLDVPEPPLETAVLLGNELVTNAVQHARTRFEVRLRAHALHVRVEVRDTNAAAAEARIAGVEETSGRGLAMLNTLADSWGVDRDATGKAVWAELRV
jgi:anti-sigma regulatory factor (Ser/Thr protein kinase)